MARTRFLDSVFPDWPGRLRYFRVFIFSRCVLTMYGATKPVTSGANLTQKRRERRERKERVLTAKYAKYANRAWGKEGKSFNHRWTGMDTDKNLK